MIKFGDLLVATEGFVGIAKKKNCTSEDWHGTSKGLFRCPARPDPFWREIGM